MSNNGGSTMRKLFAVLAVAVVAVVGCGDDDDAPSYVDPLAGMDEGPGDGPQILEFGSTHTFPSGLEVTLSASKCDSPPPSNSEMNGQMVKLDITVVNGTQDIIFPDVTWDFSSEGRSVTSWGGDFCGDSDIADLFPGETVSYVEPVEVFALDDVLRVEVRDPEPKGTGFTNRGEAVYFSGVPA